MNYIAALGGHRPRPVKRSFAYCALGCGDGLSLALLAASNPHARFVGVDEDASSIAATRELAARCALTNVALIEAGVGQTSRKELPPFDFIAARGQWSWAKDKARADMVSFLERRLKPGGLFTLGYHALPGCADALPAREMMVTYANHKGGDADERLRNGLAYVRFMTESRAGLFERRPDALRHLEDLLASDPQRAARDYLTADWRPEYFSSVSRSLAEAGLGFAGAWPPALNYMDLGVPSRFQEFFLTAPDRDTFEAHVDFVRDTRYRIDYYVRSRAARVPDPWAKGLFDAVVFTPMALPQERAAVTRVGDVDLALQESLAGALQTAMANGPTTLLELSATAGLAGFAPAEVARGLQYLVLAQGLAPGVRKPAAALRGGISAANHALLERAAAAGEETVVLASTVLGAGLVFRTGDALAYAGQRGRNNGRTPERFTVMMDRLAL